MTEEYPSKGPPLDPTQRTVEIMLREVDHLKEVLVAKNLAYDQAIELLQARQDAQPQPIEVQNAVDALRQLMDCRFNAIDHHQIERDKRHELARAAAELAVDAALSSADKAVAKQESTTKEQLGQIQASMIATSAAQDQRTADLKDRLTVLESVDRTRGAEKIDQRGGQAAVVGIMGLGIALVAVLITVATIALTPANEVRIVPPPVATSTSP